MCAKVTTAQVVMNSTTNQICRIFLLDKIEANYVDAMHSFIQAVSADNWTTKFNITDICLITQHDSLLGHWWSSFHLARRF